MVKADKALRITLIAALLSSTAMMLAHGYEGNTKMVPVKTVTASTPAPLPPPPPALNELPPPHEVGTFTMALNNEPLVNATYDSMPYVIPLNPAGPQETMVRWVDGWGQSPTFSEQGTVYVLGHAWSQQPLVFNPLSELVTANALDTLGIAVESSGDYVERRETDVLNGTEITLTDGEGRGRQWIVDNAFLIDKYQAIDDVNLMDDSIPGRIVLIACSVDGATDLGFNVVVTGYLK